MVEVIECSNSFMYWHYLRSNQFYQYRKERTINNTSYWFLWLHGYRYYWSNLFFNHMRRHNAKHLAFIRTLPCIICGDNVSTEAAHIRMADGRIAKPITGIGIKPDDRFALPLCGKHHREQHSIGENKFWQWHDPVLYALALYSVSGDAEEAERIINAAYLYDFS